MTRPDDRHAAKPDREQKRDPLAVGPPTADDAPTLFEASRQDPSDRTGGQRDDPGIPDPRPSIGPYRILGKLGEGGMGIVYEAEQRQPRRLVALKVIRGGAFVDELRVRMFQREIDTLARLKHPHIGAIYDAGRTDAGEHYFAMELVRGRMLDDYIAGRGLPLDDRELRFRLRLFSKICQAVNYAHQRGVIHRDLKPSNIVVPDQDADEPDAPIPQIKILDFGLARITEADVEAQTAMTQVGAIQGTLPYMSPEQARGNSDEIDLRTDVYALGVILYEMLTGQRPYDTQKTSLIEAARIICEESPAPLRQSWRGERAPDPDLQTIVGKALEKEAARRYASAAALAEDVSLYLDSRPILARAPSATYQMRKFARRNRALVAGIAATVLALVAGVAASTTFGIREAAQRRTAEKARMDLQTVVDFQRGMLDGIDPRRIGRHLAEDLRERLDQSARERGGSNETVAARLKSFDEAMAEINTTDAALHIIDDNILARAAQEAEARFSDQPLVEAELLRSIGTTYRALGLFDRGERPLLRSGAICDSLLGPDSPEALAARQDLGVLYLQQGRIEEAEPLLRRVLDVRIRTFPPDDDRIYIAMNDLAVLEADRGTLAAAESLYAFALAGYRRKHGDSDPFSLVLLSNYAWALCLSNKLAQAESLGALALEGRRRVLGGDNSGTMESANNLAVIYKMRGKSEAAEQLYREDYENSRRILGEEHPDVLVTMTNLGRLYLAQGKHAEAEAILGKALATSRKVLPPGFYGTGFTEQAYGDALTALGRFREAETALLDAREIIIGALGPGERNERPVVESLVRLYERMGRKDEAERWRLSLSRSMARRHDEAPAQIAGD